MRRLITLLVLAAMMFPASHAQQASETDEPERVTFFLIDASGSMKKEDNASKAESKISKILTPLAGSNPNSPVSRTYFRAENRDLCYHKIDIAEPVPASDSRRQFLTSGNNDYTPIGNALQAAILSAGDGPADIYVVSDGIQSPDCGLDFCEVAYALLPIEGVDVTPIPVGQDAEESERLACINDAQAQSKPLLANTDDGLAGVGEQGDGIPDGESPPPLSWWESTRASILFWTKAFVRKWFWLGAIALISLAAYRYGRHQAKSAREYEEWTKEARSYQDQIQDGDDLAPAKLNALIAKVEQREKPASKDKPATTFRSRWKNRLTPGPKSLGFAGGAALLALAMFPSTVFGVSLVGTKEAAWSIANSEFATAFAVLWIAVVFYAGSQFQRHQEAQHYFGIVTHEAKRTADREADEAQRASFNAYERSFDKFRHSHFPLYDPPVDSMSEDRLTDRWRDDSQLLIDRAKSIALGPQLQKSDAKKLLDQEAARIDRLEREVRRTWFGRDHSVIVLVDRLISEGKIVGDAPLWIEAAFVLERGGNLAAWESVSSLATTMRDGRTE